MDQFSTPMMKQYQKIKKQYVDCLLFYRMGDFYELFLEDAYIGARVLDITLTGKSNGKNNRIPMAGVPYHAVDSYLAKLVKAGYKVAICEQLSPPRKNALVERAVVRIVTPGTVLDEKSLNKKENNYIISLAIQENTISISSADISTGYFQTVYVTNSDKEQTILNELSRIKPTECILSPELYNDPQLLRVLKTDQYINVFCFQDWETYSGKADNYLKQYFGITSLAGFGIEDQLLTKQTAAALLGYLQHTQQGAVKHIKKITSVSPDTYMRLDKATIVNLELFSTIRDQTTHGSLVSVIDNTITAMGGRELREWIRKPLRSIHDISNRHDAVEELIEMKIVCSAIRDNLTKIPDVERLLSRLAVGIGNARDLISLRNSIRVINDIKNLLDNTKSASTAKSAALISHKLQKVDEIISKTIKDEPGIDIRNGNLIKEGIHVELDALRKKILHSKNWLSSLEISERKRTGISSLKVRFNQVFGFYIEISKANFSLIPDNYIRKQTLVNGERFITPELKEQEEIILTAEQKVFDLEFAIFQETLRKVLSHTTEIQNAAKSIATIDCLTNFACIAAENRYVRPLLLTNGELNIQEGRHPVVEKLLEQEKMFVPNDLNLNDSQNMHIITGPNMAGKSVLIRQTALIVLLNQIGCFVPAVKAELSIVDSIFVRSGASDVITSGLSTFMVEMVETAQILHHTTNNSLIVMDEIGRGTSTIDGISIAWAVAEYLALNKNGVPKVLFATHYHELQALEHQYPENIKNYHLSVLEENNQPVFLYTYSPGGASSSYGVAVAKLAGLPDKVIQRAKELQIMLEKRTIVSPDSRIEKTGIAENTILEHFIVKELHDVDIHQTTPLEALNVLAELKNKLKLLQSDSHQFSKAD